jgi:hypothetical protein
MDTTRRGERNLYQRPKHTFNKPQLLDEPRLKTRLSVDMYIAQFKMLFLYGLYFLYIPISATVSWSLLRRNVWGGGGQLIIASHDFATARTSGLQIDVVYLG